MWQSKLRGGKGLAPCRPADEHRVGSENSGTQTRASAPKCPLASGVLSNLPVPRCLSQPTSGTIPQVKTCSLSLWLQPPQVLRANLNLFISCVTVINSAADTWPPERLQSFRETRNLPDVGRFLKMPSGVSALNAFLLSPDFLKGNLSSLSLSLAE